jgi:glycogen debranching enzyme
LVADRMLRPDMWSGWGVRTLSSEHLGYNPISYQRGSVWPHDNAILVAGLMTYGLTDGAHTVVRGQLEAAVRFNQRRLPEVFAGFERDGRSFPVQYLGANVPQAWAAGAVVHMTEALLGLRPDAHAGVLEIEPALPQWTGSVRLDGLRVGRAYVDLTVDGTDAQVRSVSGDLAVRIRS